MQKRKRFIFLENGRKYMTQRDFERKQRYGIRKFTVGTASVVIGTLVFGFSPVLAQESTTTSSITTEQKDPVSPKLPKEAETGSLANLDKELADQVTTVNNSETEAILKCFSPDTLIFKNIITIGNKLNLAKFSSISIILPPHNIIRILHL